MPGPNEPSLLGRLFGGSDLPIKNKEMNSLIEKKTGMKTSEFASFQDLGITIPDKIPGNKAERAQVAEAIKDLIKIKSQENLAANSDAFDKIAKAGQPWNDQTKSQISQAYLKSTNEYGALSAAILAQAVNEKFSIPADKDSVKKLKSFFENRSTLPHKKDLEGEAQEVYKQHSNMFAALDRVNAAEQAYKQSQSKPEQSAPAPQQVEPAPLHMEEEDGPQQLAQNAIDPDILAKLSSTVSEVEQSATASEPNYGQFLQEIEHDIKQEKKQAMLQDITIPAADLAKKEQGSRVDRWNSAMESTATGGSLNNFKQQAQASNSNTSSAPSEEGPKQPQKIQKRQ